MSYWYAHESGDARRFGRLVWHFLQNGETHCRDKHQGLDGLGEQGVEGRINGYEGRQLEIQSQKYYLMVPVG